MNPLLLAIAANTIPSGYTGETITAAGSGIWTPPAEIIGQSITVQCWGAGANGSDYGGGGGGEFAQSNFTVAGNVDYFIASPSDDRTRWDAGVTDDPQAYSGSGQTGGTGGTGTITYDGGDGGNRNGPRAGGGGGAGGDLGAGARGDNAPGFGGAGGNGGISGNTDPEAGRGGAGGGTGGDGQNGSQPGGGGGGSVADTPGTGANGQITIIYPAI